MIAITCTNCKADLMIDDAFAGGVCRCQYCGTIQTVPAKSKASASPMATPKPVAANAQKALFQNQSRVRQAAASAPGTGLDDIASAVASSGLSDSGLTNSRLGTAKADAKARATKPKSPLLLILIGSGVLIVLLLVVLIVVLASGHGSSKGGGSDGTADTGNTGTASGSNFCGIPLHMGSVIFVLDRGNSLSNDFDTLKAVTFNTLDQLGPARKFQVILWDNDSGPAEYPAGQMKDATNGATSEARRYFQDTIATGRSHLSGALKEAASRGPQEIVIATGKGAFELDDEDVAVLRSLIGKNIRVDAIQIQTSPSPIPELQEVSRATGGQFRVVSPSDLRNLAH
jgi:hypothetical protein